ncbi:MAG: hypothetical protein PHC69_09155, partial [Ruminiclostridium sp.]|nr:hypothetical protein [Ruminiclostridium sp.]
HEINKGRFPELNTCDSDFFFVQRSNPNATASAIMELSTMRIPTFNTHDQRLYVNSKYGFLNIPLSLKVEVKILDDGLEISGGDLKIGSINAPGFIKKQIPENDLKYSFKYADFDLPDVFTVKDVKFGSGIMKVTIHLIPEKIAQYAADQRNTVMSEIDKFKSGQSSYVTTFINKLVGSGALSEAKIKEYAMSLLEEEDLINSALLFATTSDPGRYEAKMTAVQNKVTEWTAPLQNIKYYGSIDETVSKVLYDQDVRDLLSWFVPDSSMTEVTKTVEEYYGMYKDYYGMYEDILASIDSSAAGIDTKKIREYTKLLLENTSQVEEARIYLRKKVSELDDTELKQFIGFFEMNDKAAAEYYEDLKDLRSAAKDVLDKSYAADVEKINTVIDNRSKFVVDVVNKLKSKEYEQVLDRISNDGIIDKKTKALIDNYTKDADIKDAITYLD